VTSAGQRNATPIGVAFLCVFRSNLGSKRLGSAEMCRRPKVHLPAGVDGCSIRFAYQAADASHPKGQSKLAAEQGNFAAGSFLTRLQRRNSHRKGITRGKRLPHRIDSRTGGAPVGFWQGMGKAEEGPFFEAAKRQG
jgi:hypothetical protein